LKVTDSAKSPFPISQKGNQWEVLVEVEGEFHERILCDSRADAEAIADGRPLLNLRRAAGRCDVSRVKRCVEAFSNYGYDQEIPFVRHLHRFAHRLKSESARQKLSVR
jgi:hypothetical protein